MRRFGLSIFALLLTSFVTQAYAQPEMPKPSEEHKIVMADVGHWKVKGTLFMGGQEQEFEGKESVTNVGGFWTVSQYSATMFGQPFRGSSTNGYDPKSKKYVGSWVDSMQPHATHMVGTYNKESKTMTFETTGVGMDGKPSKGKIVVKYKDGAREFTMWGPDPSGGKEMVKVMAMTYTKVKKGSDKK